MNIRYEDFIFNLFLIYFIIECLLIFIQATGTKAYPQFSLFLPLSFLVSFIFYKIDYKNSKLYINFLSLSVNLFYLFIVFIHIKNFHQLIKPSYYGVKNSSFKIWKNGDEKDL